MCGLRRQAAPAYAGQRKCEGQRGEGDAEHLGEERLDDVGIQAQELLTDVKATVSLVAPALWVVVRVRDHFLHTQSRFPKLVLRGGNDRTRRRQHRCQHRHVPQQRPIVELGLGGERGGKEWTMHGARSTPAQRTTTCSKMRSSRA